MSIALFTEYGDNYKEIAVITTPIMREYCSLRGYDFHEVRLWDETRWPYKKHWKIRDLFDLGYKMVWYLDVDAVITNLNYRIEDFIDDEHSFFITKDFNELNGGSVIIKNDKNGRLFNDMVLNAGHTYENEQNFYNAAFEGLRSIMKVLPHPSINSYDYSLYPECKEYVGREDLGDWKEGHFILHVPALGIDKRIEVLKSAKITR